MLTVFFICDINGIASKKEEIKLKTRTLTFLIVAILVCVVIFVLPFVNEQRETYKAEALNEDEIHAEAFIVGDGSEKGLVKIRVIVDNSDNKITKASILKVYDEYAKYSGAEQHFAGNIYDFSEIKIEEGTGFGTEFEVSKNKKYIIKIQVENKWNHVNIYIPLNAW